MVVFAVAFPFALAVAFARGKGVRYMQKVKRLHVIGASVTKNERLIISAGGGAYLKACEKVEGSSKRSLCSKSSYVNAHRG